MDAREIAGVYDIIGGVKEAEYNRKEDTENLLATGVFRPEFDVQGPYRASNRGGGNHIFLTDLHYVFDPSKPWLPEQLINQVKIEFDKLNAEGAFVDPIVQISVTVEPDSGPNLAPFPNTGKFKKAYEHSKNGDNTNAKSKKHILSMKRQNRNNVDWATLLAFVASENRYDEENEIMTDYGNRMSRMKFTIIEYRIPKGSGVSDDLGLPPRSVVTLPEILNGLCGQGCLAYAIASDSDKKNYKKTERSTLATEALKMSITIDVKGAMAVNDFDRFTEKYQFHPVVIMENRTTVLYFTESEYSKVKSPIYLLLHKGHYHVIANMDSFIRPTKDSRVKWCDYCRAAVSSTVGHACSGSCKNCKHTFNADEATHMVPTAERCTKCNFGYKFVGCIPRHRCSQYSCLQCRACYPKKHAASHVCEEEYCRRCDESTMPGEPPHRCFIIKTKPTDPDEFPQTWVYDIESTLDELGESVVHRIAVVVAVKLYTRERVIFRGKDVETDFLSWIDRFSVLTTLIAHNGASYDSYLILGASRRHRVDLPTSLVVIGSKLPFMKYKHCRIIDSMRHITGSLERMAATFKLGLSKGFFPYRFYTQHTLLYIGDIPPKNMFDIHASKVEEFEKWYLTFPPGSYSIEDEVIKYCTQDTEILGLCMEKYRDAAIETSGIDPLEKVTIASYAMTVYRSKHMSPKTFPILTRTEYEFARRGLFGGRTDARQVHRVWSPEDIANGNYGVYVDVHSMYPTVQKYDPLPVGIPWWHGKITGADACAAWLNSLVSGCNEKDGDEKDGDEKDGQKQEQKQEQKQKQNKCAMVECTVECPKDLYHPVLLEKRNNRLIAALDIKNGTFTSVELILALKHGYKVTTISKALCSNTSTKSFDSYVSSFYALKEKHDKTGPLPNSGLYALAKMMLNSLWGKFGQRDEQQDSRIYTNEQSWYSAVANLNSGKLSSLITHEINNDYIFATSTSTDNEQLHLDTTDVFMAAFVTANARCRLYAALSLLTDRVLYHDTDSVMYERIKGMPDMNIGPGLGEWGDEVGYPITEYVALGPKTYAYAYTSPNGPKTVVKSKGFATGFTLEQYREMALATLDHKEPLSLEQKSLHFERSRVKGSTELQMTTNTSFTKKLIVSLQKVHIVSACRTLPFGHCEIHP